MSENEKRNIKDVLDSRSDMSPFLTHLTKDKDSENNAKAILSQIITDKFLKQNTNKVSPISFGSKQSYKKWDSDKQNSLLSAICFTETPLKELQSLLAIQGRKVNLKEYGFVFIKDKLILKNISPVLYLNNYDDKVDEIIYALGEIVDQENFNDALKRLFPLFSIIGKKVDALSSPLCTKDDKFIDFYWEREWRLPYIYGDFLFNYDDIFVGLCNSNDITYFEDLTSTHFGKKVPFIDPTKNISFYSKKLDEQAKATGINLKHL